jgi:hypothetical protein
MKRSIVMAALLMASARGAHADDEAHLHSVVAEAQFFMGAGANEQIGGIQTFAGVTAEPVDAHVEGGRVFGVLGAHVEWGSVMSDHTMLEPTSNDPTMLEEVPAGAVRFVVAPQLRVGVAWERKHWPVWAFAGAGPSWSRAWAEAEDAPWIPEVGRHRGVRGAIGASIGFVHAEIMYEHIAGADRAGLAVGVGL